MTSPSFSADSAAALSGPAWLRARRVEAATRLASLAMPTAGEEVWRYSPIGDLDLGTYEPALTAVEGASASDLDLASGFGVVIRTGNGHVLETAGTAEGVTVTHGDELVDDGAIGAAFDAPGDAIAQLHDAFAIPVVVDVAPSEATARIVVIRRISGADTAVFGRLVVRVAPTAVVEVVEVFVSDDGIRSLSVPVTEVVVGRDATARYSSLQLLGDATWQLGRLVSTVEAGGSLTAGTAAFGGDYARLRVDTRLAGRGANGEIDAAYFGDGSQHLDFRTFQDHAAPDTTSRLLFKGALGQKASAVYTGLIKIRPEGRGSEAFQTNRNLKLSDDAWAESVPNLEIENNEVQCSHASTVSPVDPEQRFYLESRGVPTDRADRLIVRGFFDEVLDRLVLGDLSTVVAAELDAALERSLA